MNTRLYILVLSILKQPNSLLIFGLTYISTYILVRMLCNPVKISIDIQTIIAKEQKRAIPFNDEIVHTSIKKNHINKHRNFYADEMDFSNLFSSHKKTHTHKKREEG